MKKAIIIYPVTLFLFLFLDALWLGVIGKDLYPLYLGPLLAKNIRWGAALVFYVLYAAGILYFVILPSLHQKGMKKPLIDGALLGLLCYGTYDLTNLATLQSWPVPIVIIDLLWGSFITSVTSCLVFILVSKFRRYIR